jgi:hypothetical protein
LTCTNLLLILRDIFACDLIVCDIIVLDRHLTLGLFEPLAQLVGKTGSA